MSGFILDLGQLSQGSNRFRLEADAAEVGLASAGWPGRLIADCTVERTGDRISVRGILKAGAWLECVRCLKGYERNIETTLEVFAERHGAGRRRDEDELERGDYMKFHDGRRLDLTDEARESLLLEIPIAPVCREDCRGLCPRCGADLNDGPCACQDPGEVR
jgi:uncharacterized protein